MSAKVNFAKCSKDNYLCLLTNSCKVCTAFLAETLSSLMAEEVGYEFEKKINLLSQPQITCINELIRKMKTFVDDIYNPHQIKLFEQTIKKFINNSKKLNSKNDEAPIINIDNLLLKLRSYANIYTEKQIQHIDKLITDSLDGDEKYGWSTRKWD
jgi:hypothetical protein